MDALVAYLESSEPTLDGKNRAIGLLGELRDRRALPVLDALDRGDAATRPLRVPALDQQDPSRGTGSSHWRPTGREDRPGRHSVILVLPPWG